MSQDDNIRCTETKRDGNPCMAWAVRGRNVCAGHAGLGIASNPDKYREQARIAQNKAHAARVEARKRTPADWLALKLEQNAEQIVANALKASDEGDWRAGAWLFERVLGKPKELLTVDTSEQEIKKMTPEQRAELRRRALEMHPELSELVPRSESA